MNTWKLFDDSRVCIFILLLTSHIGICIDKELPSFIGLPPTIQYRTTGDLSIELKCDVWPTTAKVKFMISKRIQSSNVNPSQSKVELNLLDGNVGELISPRKLRISNPLHFKSIQDVNIHCLAETEFAAVLSRPFRITDAIIMDFSSGSTSTAKPVIKNFLRGNVAMVDCLPPVSYPRAEVKFNFNDVEINDGGRYRIIQWPDGKRVSLLIHPAETSDNGQYRCTATNPITRQTKHSAEVIDMVVKVPTTSMAPIISMPISGRVSGSQQIMARAGTNVTLFCLMQGAPPPQIQTYSHNTDLISSNRYSVDRDFGLLQITDLKVSDTGSYMCGDKYITSSGVLRVLEPLNITTRPVNVVLDTLSASARFDCVSSQAASSVQWYFNGRSIVAQSDGAVVVSQDGSLHIQTVAVTDLGIYQCVVEYQDEWVSASATLATKAYRLISASEGSHSLTEVVRAPLVQNVDTQEHILSTPTASRIHDNLALYVKWSLNDNKLGDVTYYVLQLVHKGSVDTKWSPPVTVQAKINLTFYYVTHQHVQPQNLYRLRVHAFFKNGHTITSNLSGEVNFLDVGDVAPVIEESSVKSPGTIDLRWSYNSVDSWPVDTFRVLYRQTFANGTSAGKRFDKYSMKDVSFPTLNATLDNLDAGMTYQLTVYGINSVSTGRTITRYSHVHIVSMPVSSKTTSKRTSSSTDRFFSGLLESWKSNKLLYGSLFALTGFLIIVMLLLLLLCLCRQRRFRKNKDTSSSHTFPYAYKEVSKTSSAANNNSSTLQMPGRMSQYSSQVALQQFQPNNASIDRRTADTVSQIHRAGSSHAMETSSLVTDIYNPNYIQVGQMQHPYQGFSTLPQGYNSQGSSGHNSRNNPQYQNFLQQQQLQQAHLNSMRRDNPAGDSNRDSMIEQSMEMPARNASLSQQQLMMLQSQEQQRASMGYYNSRPGGISPQIMMMGSQHSLGPYGQYRRPNSQNYQGHIETPIALNASGHPVYQMDQMIVDPSCRSISPQYQQYIQQQAAQAGSVQPSMMDLYSQSHGYIRPGAGDYSQQSLYRQQCRRSDSDCSATEPGYAYLPTHSHPGSELIPSRQHTLNSLPEQPSVDNGNNNQHQKDSPANSATKNDGNNSSSRHHHRRKTRNRQQNVNENHNLELGQGDHHNDLPPTLAPRSKMPFSDNANNGECQDACIDEVHMAGGRGERGERGEHALQYSGHYDPNDNENAGLNNSLLIENLPRIRDVSEYGIPVNNNGHGQQQQQQQQRAPKHNPPPQQQQAPVPPLKTAGRQQAANHGYLDCQPDYYSSATSSDRSGPSPPPKYAPGHAPLPRPDEAYIKNLYYHGDTHC